MDVQQFDFYDVLCTIGRLEYIDEIIVGEECREMFGYHPFQFLTENT